MKENLKMYILIQKWIPVGFAVNSAAHASLAGYLKWQDDPVTQEWLNFSFRKVACKVTEREFNYAKGFSDYLVITESALDDEEVAIVFKPREEWPTWFTELSLYKGDNL